MRTASALSIRFSGEKPVQNRISLFSAAISALLIHLLQPALAREPVALVYRGPGSCENGCSEAVAAIAERAGLIVRYVSPATLTPKVFRDAVVWMQPGGNATDVANALSEKQKRHIRDFVRRGGGYVGICAGAFFADTKLDQKGKVRALGLIPGTTPEVFPAHAATMLITWNGEPRHIFFEEGGTFKYGPNESVEVIATYPDHRPAAIQVTYGKGQVVVSGVHPEAPVEWKRIADTPDPDGQDDDLADELLERALGY